LLWNFRFKTASACCAENSFKYFTLDPSSAGQLLIKLSDEKPSPLLERSLTDEALEYHRNNSPIESMSDGVKAFIGIIISIIADDPKVITIDEPEAFLHPSLTFKLGKEVGNILNRDNSKKVFVSTHSAKYLMGSIQSGVPLNIVRLTYSNNIPTARLLESEKISKLMRHPLLRSVGTLNGLFYEYVVVTESDSDRAFYQEINERLLLFAPEKGIPNCLFLNAQNKQTVHEIMKPLREMGIPCVGIVDIDIVKEGGQNWTNLMEGSFVHELTKRKWKRQEIIFGTNSRKLMIKNVRKKELKIFQKGTVESVF
jgi:energy-coupling factor transporter ATP-binding protein EcfA2